MLIRPTPHHCSSPVSAGGRVPIHSTVKRVPNTRWKKIVVVGSIVWALQVRPGQVSGHTPEQRDGTPSSSVWPSPMQTPGPPCPYLSDRPPSGHRPGRSQARLAHILQIGVRLAIAQADARSVMLVIVVYQTATRYQAVKLNHQAVYSEANA